MECSICLIAAVCTVVEIVSLKCIGSQSWLLGHVALAVTWPLDSLYVIPTNMRHWHQPTILTYFQDIKSLNISRDVIGHVTIQFGAYNFPLLELTLYLQSISRY